MVVSFTPLGNVSKFVVGINTRQSKPSVQAKPELQLLDQRHRILLNGSKSVDRRAGKNPSLLAKYEKTRAYRSAIAKKALKTKMANLANTNGSAGAPQDPPATPPVS